MITEPVAERNRSLHAFPKNRVSPVRKNWNIGIDLLLSQWRCGMLLWVTKRGILSWRQNGMFSRGRWR